MSDDPFGCVAALVVALCLSFVAGFTLERHLLRADAVKNGVAEYACDPQTGGVEFRWKSPSGSERGE